MRYETVEFECGHKLVDNGVGDYDFHCPKIGNLRFVHRGIVWAMAAGEWVCACGEKVGRRSEGAPEPYTTQPETP